MPENDKIKISKKEFADMYEWTDEKEDKSDNTEKVEDNSYEITIEQGDAKLKKEIEQDGF